MRTLQRLGLALFLLTAAAPFGHAGDPNPPTGTYVGTLTRIRRLTAPPTTIGSVVKQKTVTKVTGLGYVPTGGSDTFIRLILPGRNLFDEGTDILITLDFSTTPAKVIVSDATQATDVTVFSTVTVKGKVVTCLLTFADNSSPDFKYEDARTLTITRTKPLSN